VERVSWARMTQPEEPGFVMGIEAFIVHGPVDSSWAAASPRSETRAVGMVALRSVTGEGSGSEVDARSRLALPREYQ